MDLFENNPDFWDDLAEFQRMMEPMSITDVVHKIEKLKDIAIENEEYEKCRDYIEEIFILKQCNFDSTTFIIEDILEKPYLERLLEWEKADRNLVSLSMDGITEKNMPIIGEVHDLLMRPAVTQMEKDKQDSDFVELISSYLRGERSYQPDNNINIYASWLKMRLARNHYEVDGDYTIISGVSDEELLKIKKKYMGVAFKDELHNDKAFSKYKELIAEYYKQNQEFVNTQKRSMGIPVVHSDIDNDVVEYYGIDESIIFDTKKRIMDIAEASKGNLDVMVVYNDLIKSYKNEWIKKTIENKRKDGLL